MKPVYVLSTEGYSGKTGLCASLALEARDRRLSIGYMKPIGTLPLRVEGALVDEDCYNLSKVLELDGAPEQMSPVMLTPQFIHAHLAHPRLNCPAAVVEAYESYSRGKDLVVLEGTSHLHEGRWIGLSPRQICELLNAAALLVVKFEHELVLDEILAAKDMLKERLIGAVLNLVPGSKLPLINDSVIPFLTDQRITVLGTVVKDHRLLSATVAELVDELGGRLVSGEERTGEVVESLMVGAMGQEKALALFRQKNKAVITGGDREDVQLAALETPTRALILSGNLQPTKRVVRRAEEAGVPIVVVDMDTLTAVERMEALVGRVRVHDRSRVERVRAMLSGAIDLNAILDGLVE